MFIFKPTRQFDHMSRRNDRASKKGEKKRELDPEEEHSNYREYSDWSGLLEGWKHYINTSRLNNPIMHGQPYLTAKKPEPIISSQEYLWDDAVTWDPPRSEESSDVLNKLFDNTHI